MTNNDVTNQTRVTHLEDTDSKWIDINIFHVVGLPIGASITLELTTEILDRGNQA